MTDPFPPEQQTQQPGNPFRDRLETRLAALRDEFARGQDELSQLEARARYLREQLLRIAGAIQVLEEELKDNPGSE